MRLLPAPSLSSLPWSPGLPQPAWRGCSGQHRFLVRARGSVAATPSPGSRLRDFGRPIQRDVSHVCSATEGSSAATRERS
jgi:hypothetical protein